MRGLISNSNANRNHNQRKKNESSQNRYITTATQAQTRDARPLARQMKTLERPTPKKAMRAQTPFHYEAEGVPGWLGCELWSTPPSYPNRSRCQRDVLDAERKEAARIVDEYREAEKLSADNDLSWRQKQLYDHSLNPAKKLTPEQCQAIQVEMISCDHQKWLSAQSQLRELRGVAGDLARTILERLAKSFDAELQERALEAESRLTADFIPLQNGQDWELHHSPDVVKRHCWRELAKNAIRYLNQENSIGAIQWLATSEEHVPNVPWI
jgi:hypothetical protein